MIVTDIADEFFKIGNTQLGLLFFGTGIVTCILALFCRLRGSK